MSEFECIHCDEIWPPHMVRPGGRCPRCHGPLLMDGKDNYYYRAQERDDADDSDRPESEGL